MVDRPLERERERERERGSRMKTRKQLFNLQSKNKYSSELMSMLISFRYTVGSLYFKTVVRQPFLLLCHLIRYINEGSSRCQ